MFAERQVDPVVWEVFEEVCTNSDVGSYTSYGIAAYALPRDVQQLLVKQSDIGVCRQAVEQFAELLTTYALSPIHIHDAIEDYFGML